MLNKSEASFFLFPVQNLENPRVILLIKVFQKNRTFLPLIILTVKSYLSTSLDYTTLKCLIHIEDIIFFLKWIVGINCLSKFKIDCYLLLFSPTFILLYFFSVLSSCVSLYLFIITLTITTSLTFRPLSLSSSTDSSSLLYNFLTMDFFYRM